MAKYPRALFAIMSAVFLLSVSSPALAIGISPPEVNSPNALNGVAQTKYIHISRNPLDVGELMIRVSAKGEYASYLSYEPEILLPADKEFVDYPIDIAPTTAAPGTYSIPVFFIIEKVVEGVDGEGSGSQIVTGIAAKVSFTVTGERVTGYAFDNLGLDPVESTTLPLLLVGIRNTGNVDWKPERATVSFVDQNDPEHIVSVELAGERFDLVGAGKTTQARIELVDYLPEGVYVATMEFFDGGVSVGIVSSGSFTVYPTGTLSQSGELSGVTTKKDAYEPGERVILSATFKNTGQLRLNGVLMTEVYKDGTYVDLVRGEELQVDASQESSFAQTLTLSDPGSYVLTSYVKFGSKKTVTKDVGITVAVPKAVAVVNSTMGIVALSGIILLAVILFVAFRKIRAVLAGRKKKTLVTTTEPVVKTSEPTVVSDQKSEPSETRTDESARW